MSPLRTLLRGLLKLLAGYLLAVGVLNEGQAETWGDAAAEVLAPIVLYLAAEAWSFYVARQRARVTRAALALPSGSTLEEARARAHQDRAVLGR